MRAKLLVSGVVMAVGLMIWHEIAKRTNLPQSDYLAIAVIAMHVLVAIALVAGHVPSVSRPNSWERLVVCTRWWLLGYCLIVIASKSYILISSIAFRHSFAP